MENRLILLLETATSICSVAIALNGNIIAFEEIDERNIHSARITIFIEKVLKDTGLSFTNLDAIAISKGPGSYTGLRIGVSTAKGLCFALDKPLISVGSLESLTQGMFNTGKVNKGSLIVPMIDARRMEVFTAIFSSQFAVVEEVNAKIINADSFRDLNAPEILIIGDGASKFREIFKMDKRILFPPVLSSAIHMSALADERYRNMQFENLAYFEPFYLKEFVSTVPRKIA